ncbi:Laminin subunit alpha-2 isoform 1 [Phytophthora megakarya]|uniref:Laminin subunit alpha-2 isoform 1 n=1 Tax=Phytophthora megakarya TaxID=4795 RepID=A0A225VJG5_9STRA|nr:Laminin subunit alpha-2 isoform 1 [Phytophthora megakarya]
MSSSQKWKWVERYVAARNKTTGRIDYKELSTKTEFIIFKGHHEEKRRTDELKELKLAYEEDCARKRIERECKDLTSFSPGVMVELVLDGVRGQSEETRGLVRNLFQEDTELKAASLQLACTRYHFSSSPSQSQVQDTAAQMPVDKSEKGDLTEDYEELKSSLNQAIAVHMEKTTQKMNHQMHYEKKLKEMTEFNNELEKYLAEREDNVDVYLTPELKRASRELEREIIISNGLKKNLYSIRDELVSKDKEVKDLIARTYTLKQNYDGLLKNHHNLQSEK